MSDGYLLEKWLKPQIKQTRWWERGWNGVLSERAKGWKTRWSKRCKTEEMMRKWREKKTENYMIQLKEWRKKKNIQSKQQQSVCTFENIQSCKHTHTVSTHAQVKDSNWNNNNKKKTSNNHSQNVDRNGFEIYLICFFISFFCCAQLLSMGLKVIYNSFMFTPKIHSHNTPIVWRWRIGRRKPQFIELKNKRATKRRKKKIALTQLESNKYVYSKLK